MTRNPRICKLLETIDALKEDIADWEDIYVEEELDDAKLLKQINDLVAENEKLEFRLNVLRTSHEAANVELIALRASTEAHLAVVKKLKGDVKHLHSQAMLLGLMATIFLAGWVIAFFTS